MTTLNRSTRRRLKTLPQIPSVWEGDRRPLSAPLSEDPADEDASGNGECIIWVDGFEGIVRAMDVVSPEIGQEAIVRTLLRAMEHPHTPAGPARPQKIVVRDRELQFFLRGVLQELEITIEYEPELPLIDEVFRGFQELASHRPPQLPRKYADLLLEKAYEIWQDAPWDFLADHQIISLELNQWDIGTLYVSVMGMLGMEYGVLLYRSLDSLKRFRATVLAEESFEQLEEAFLGQDCLFVTFEQEDDNGDDDDDDIDLADLPMSEIQPSFGNVHPLEGMRPFLYDEEAIAVYIALEALHRFFRAGQKQLAKDKFPTLTKNYRIPVPEEATPRQTISVKVATVPDVSSDLFHMAELAAIESDEDADDADPPLRDDLVPKNSFLSLGMVTWERLELLRAGIGCYESKEVKASGEGMPVIMIQTTRPKALEMIQNIKTAGGIKGIGFNPGEDPFEGDRYDLGILQTENGDLYLFGEFIEEDPVHVAARKKWDQRCKKTKGYCGLIIARGLTGASRGNPQFNDMMAFFEARSLSAKDLGMGTLQLIPQFD